MPIGKHRKPGFGEIAGLAYRQHPRYKGVVGHWLMGEGAGTKIRDISGFGNDGTTTNMEGDDWTLGQFGTVLDIGGTDEHVLVPFTARSNPSVTTIAAWVNITGGAGTFRTIMTSRASNKGYSLYADSGDNFRFWWYNGTTEVACGTGASNDVVENTWFHIAGWANGANCTLYVNGVLNQQKAIVYVPTDSQAPRFGYQTSNSFPLTGQLADIRIWDRVLSPSEIWSLYTEPFLEFRRRPIWAPALAAEGITTEYVGPIWQQENSGFVGRVVI